ncbi:hypothetical protein Tco_1395538 [Tanacetum coccineum]
MKPFKISLLVKAMEATILTLELEEQIIDTTRAQQKALDDELVAPANPFEITADVPEIYMQEFWVTSSRHHSSLCFKMNGKSHIVNVDNFRDMLKICPKLPGRLGGSYKKLVQVPYGNETLTFCGNESSNGRESRLTVISCLKAQEYMAKGCQVFLAQISAKKEEDKSEGKQIEDVPIVRDFPEVFPEDLPGLL